MMLYLTLCNDNYKRLHKDLKNSKVLYRIIKVEMLYISEKELEKNWIYFGARQWWREK